MSGIIALIIGILGAAAPYLPVIEKMLVGFGAFLAEDFKKLFGIDAPQVLEDAIATTEQIVTVVEDDLPAAIAWLKNNFPNLDALVAAEPGVVKSLFASDQAMKAHKIGKSSARKLVENAHGTMVLKAAGVP